MFEPLKPVGLFKLHFIKRPVIGFIDPVNNKFEKRRGEGCHTRVWAQSTFPFLPAFLKLSDYFWEVFHHHFSAIVFIEAPAALAAVGQFNQLWSH